jgi:hypothetical protein
MDWAKYTDEGWYGNAAVRAHLFGNWYLAGDFNPAVIVPVWPFAEWLLYFFTGVSVQAARGLAVGCFFASLALSYLLLRRGPRSTPRTKTCPRDPGWMALLGVTLAVTSPYVYSFSRLAILEPLQTAAVAGDLECCGAIAADEAAGAGIGGDRAAVCGDGADEDDGCVSGAGGRLGDADAALARARKAMKCALAAAASAALVYGAWLAIIGRMGLMPRLPVLPGGESLYAAGWLYLAAGSILVVVSRAVVDRSQPGVAGWSDHAGGSARAARGVEQEAVDAIRSSERRLLAVAGMVLFMTVQDHPQPRYILAASFLIFCVVALGANALVEQGGWARRAGWCVITLAGCATMVHAAKTIEYATHPEYTWVDAAEQLTRYIDTHPNGKRELVSVSGDDITLMTHLPTLCDEISFDDLGEKLERYQPGWYASWNGIDPVILSELHTHESLEQVASFPALDDPYRNVLVLFKLHPLPEGKERDEDGPGMMAPLPGDKIDVPVE